MTILSNFVPHDEACDGGFLHRSISPDTLRIDASNGTGYLIDWDISFYRNQQTSQYLNRRYAL